MRIALAEDDREGEIAQLDAEHAAALSSTGLVQVVPVDGDRWRILTRGRVGAAAVDSVEVVVAPKVGISRLLFLLGYAANPGFRPEDVEGVVDSDVWPAIAETLCRHAERAVVSGVLQGYVVVEEALALIRGRIRVSDQMSQRQGMLLPVEVRYDEYSPDIAENRVLRSALRRILTVPRLRSDVRARLLHVDGRLDGVATLPAGVPLPQWRPTRLNQSYHAALRLGELVLRYQSFEVGRAGMRIAAFVVDMAAAFEDFVGTALREAWRAQPGETREQFPVNLDVDGSVRMYVDVVHVVDGHPQIVADAKYKLEATSGRYPNADQYQMLAYCTALDKPVGWLVYAQGTGRAVERRIRNSPVSIVEYPLDLAAPPAQLLEQVTHLAQIAHQRSQRM